MVNIQIKIKSFDTHYIELTMQFIQLVTNFFHIKKVQCISLPNHIKKITVLRSPHIDKKSREQFQMKQCKKILFFQVPERAIAFFLLKILKNSEFFGIEMEIHVRFVDFMSSE